MPSSDIGPRPLQMPALFRPREDNPAQSAHRARRPFDAAGAFGVSRGWRGYWVWKLEMILEDFR
jgi:hypothetical protein